MFCFASLDGARERSRSHPSRAFGAVSRRAKIPSPRPPSFLPACWNPPAIFSDGGGTLNWVVGGVMLLIFQKLQLLTVDTYRNNLFYHKAYHCTRIYSKYAV